MTISDVPMCHEDFAICKISPRRWIVLSIYQQYFTDTKAKGGVPVYGPDLLMACQRYVQRKINERGRIS